MLFKCVLHVQHQSENWVLVCPIVQFSKSFIFCLASDRCMHSLEVTPEVYTQSYGITLWCSFLSTITPKLPGSLGPLIPVPSQKSRALVSQLCYPLLMTTSVSGTRQWEDKERIQKQEFAQALMFTCLLIEDFLSLRILGIYLLMLPSPLPLLLLKDWLGTGIGEIEKRKKK